MAADQIGQIHDIGLGPAKTMRWTDGSWGADGIWAAGTNTYLAVVVQEATDNALGELSENMDNSGDPTSGIVSGKGHEISVNGILSVPASPGAGDQTVAFDVRIEIGQVVEVNDVDAGGWVRYIATSASKSYTVTQGEPTRISVTLQRKDGMVTAIDAT